jgi:hypothetical protein
MTSPTELEHRRVLRERLQSIGTPEALADLQKLQSLHYDAEMSYLGQDVYLSAAGEGQPPAGWIRGSENLDLLRQQVTAFSHLDNDAITKYLKPERSGFRAEIYLPDPEILGPGFKPTIAFKGSSGPIALADGTKRGTALEDFAGINGPQTIGLRTDYYDRAMELARDFRQFGVRVDYTGHSLGGGLASAAVSVSGERAVTFNAAPLHPDTARDFVDRNPGARLYDPNAHIIAYQVQGEVLSDGVVYNVDRLDAFHNRQLAEVMRHSATILQNVPDEVRDELKERVEHMMPPHARVSFGAFVDQLATGDTETLLRDLPLAPGRVVPMRPMQRSDPNDPDSALVPRPDVPSFSGVSSFAGPLLDLAHREAAAARVGNEVGEWAEAGGKLYASSLDAQSDGVRAAANLAGELQAQAGRALGRATATGVRTSGEASADVREIAGKIEASVDLLQGEVRAHSAAAGASVLRSIGDIDLLPDGIQRWADRRADDLQRDGTEARQRNRAEAGQALRDANQEAAAIRQNADTVADVLDTVAVKGTRLQGDATIYAGKSLSEVLEIASDRLARASEYAPVASAAVVAGNALTGNTVAAHAMPGAVPKTAYVAREGIGSGMESFQRHLNDTVVPSVEAKVEAYESALMAKYPSLASPGKKPTETEPEALQGEDTRIRPQPSLLNEPGHAAHLLYLQAQTALSRIETAPDMGLTQHERATLGASVVAEALSAKGWNFSGVDHVVPSSRIDPQTGRPETLFIVQGDLDSPAHRRIPINLEHALSQSIEQSSAIAQNVQMTRQEALTQEQARTEAAGLDSPSGPVMRIGSRTMAPPADSGGDGGG